MKMWKFTENLLIFRQNPSEIKEIKDIPFCPLKCLKSFGLRQNFKTENYFQSSGTTQMLNRSKHYIADFNLYEESIYQSFEKFIRKPEDYIFPWFVAQLFRKHILL